jgi:hypothetical protein
MKFGKFDSHFKFIIVKLNYRGNTITPDIILIALFNVVIHFAFAGNLEYHRDELLYFSLGMHPDFGYMSVPPLIGWISWLMQNIFGLSVYAVRIFPAVLSGIMIILAASIARELGGSRYSSFLASVGLTVSIFFMRSFSLFMPVFIEITLWTICFYFIIRYVNTNLGKYLIWFGLFAGISLLNKYLAGLLFAGLVLIIPFTPHREVFRKKHFWVGIAAGALVFMPNLLWQINRGFPVFGHMSELYDTQLVHMNVLLFISEQLVMPLAGSVFTVAGVIWLLAGKDSKRFRFLGFISVFVIMALLLLKGKSYYTLGVFPLLITAGAVSWERIIKSKAIRIILPFFVIFITIPVIPVGIPVLKQDGLRDYFRVLDQKYGIDLGRRFEDGSIHSLPQDYADMIGWEQLTMIADSAWKMTEDKASAIIFAENYGQAGAITVIGKKYGLPEAICFSESFRYWFPREFDTEIKTLIYINDELGEDISALFADIKLAGKISDPDAREYGTSVYLCRNPRDSFNRFWKMRISELDSEH